MSDDQLDKEFKDRIKQVFDNYEDDTGAEGWTLLREKFPEKKGDRVVAWLWRYAGVAAVLLAMLSVALFFDLKRPIKQNTIAKNNDHKGAIIIKPSVIVKNKADSPEKIAHQSRVSPANNAPYTIKHDALAAVQNHDHKHTSNARTAPATHINKTIFTAIAGIKPPVTTVRQRVDTKVVTVNHTPSVSANNGITNATPPLNGNTTANIVAIKSDGAANVKPGVNLSPAGVDTAQKARVVANTGSPSAQTPTKKHPDIQSLFANDSKYNNLSKTPGIKSTYRKVVFGVYAATYVNYAKGSSNQFNTGAGVSADIKLTENLSLLTGVSIAQNSFNYSGITAGSPVSFPASFSYAANNAAISNTAVAPPTRNLDANLVNLEMPVDLKYMFSPGHSTAYIAAGLSSGTFINQTYNYTYSYSIDNNPTNQQSQGTSTRKTFDDFYFGKMLNVSFGMGYPLGKGNQLIIEPFFKYPLNGLGDQHILFGSGGLNLKLNFDPPKRDR